MLSNVSLLTILNATTFFIPSFQSAGGPLTVRGLPFLRVTFPDGKRRGNNFPLPKQDGGGVKNISSIGKAFGYIIQS